MPGFVSSLSNNNQAVFANNADFSGSQDPSELNGLQTNGQLWIGSTAIPHVRVGNITSNDMSVTITNGSGTIDLSTAASGGGNFVSFTPFTNNIDFTTTGNTTIYTVPVGKTFYILSLGVVATNFVGFGGDGTFNLGITSASYNDYLNGASFTVDATNKFANTIINAGAGLIATAGIDIIMNITFGITATTAIGSAYLTGVLI